MKNNLTVEGIINYIETSAKGLIFDMDGTLTDSNPAHLLAWDHACRHFGMEYPRDKFYYYAGLSSLKIAEALVKESGMSGRVDPDELSALKEKEFHKVEEMVKPVPEVLALVKYFHRRMPIAVGTGRRRTSAVRTLEKLDLLKYFDIVVTSDDVRNHKPHPDTFLECAKRMGFAPEECLVFEDAERGIEAARRAGMQVVDVRPWLPPMDLS
jgi:beta-phosphoglucomutase family hydrolase